MAKKDTDSSGIKGLLAVATRIALDIDEAIEQPKRLPPEAPDFAMVVGTPHYGWYELALMSKTGSLVLVPSWLNNSLRELLQCALYVACDRKKYKPQFAGFSNEPGQYWLQVKRIGDGVSLELSFDEVDLGLMSDLRFGHLRTHHGLHFEALTGMRTFVSEVFYSMRNIKRGMGLKRYEQESGWGKKFPRKEYRKLKRIVKNWSEEDWKVFADETKAAQEAEKGDA